MVAKSGLIRTALLGLTLLTAGFAHADDELRNTFFKEADAALAAADAVNAKLYAPKNYEKAMDEYRDAENYLARGRNIDYVRSNAADAVRYFNAAAEAASLAQTALAQAIKSRQDAANVKAPELAPELWDDAQQEFVRAIQSME